MGLIEDVTLDASGQTGAIAAWSGEGFIYVDGKRIAGPVDGEADLTLNPAEAYAIEVHDEAVTTTINMAPLTRPTIRWRTVSGAVEYRIYHTPPGGSESMVYRQPEDGSDPYGVRSPVECEHGWHQFRVEARDAGGNMSVTTPWFTRAIDKPEIPAAIAVSGSGGNITFTLTE